MLSYQTDRCMWRLAKILLFVTLVSAARKKTRQPIISDGHMKGNLTFQEQGRTINASSILEKSFDPPKCIDTPYMYNMVSRGEGWSCCSKAEVQKRGMQDLCYTGGTCYGNRNGGSSVHGWITACKGASYLCLYGMMYAYYPSRSPCPPSSPPSLSTTTVTTLALQVQPTTTTTGTPAPQIKPSLKTHQVFFILGRSAVNDRCYCYRLEVGENIQQMWDEPRCDWTNEQCRSKWKPEKLIGKFVSDSEDGFTQAYANGDRSWLQNTRWRS
eukprot:gnl/MRDRNA2_/MRDRNA2_57580_c0_seq1.p1 gnl/MRDRNA2_/MRDRNA2_57580_c0~~gnl/MRDRNA2_/MRDRNA2_57580_c0_seq1.p1  ORF type:complete len:270 (-),score=32.99 gnl/MRDRNA2_/MRDRNA2_57580_c0_seq1:60-869(-)